MCIRGHLFVLHLARRDSRMSSHDPDTSLSPTSFSQSTTASESFRSTVEGSCSIIMIEMPLPRLLTVVEAESDAANISSLGQRAEGIFGDGIRAFSDTWRAK